MADPATILSAMRALPGAHVYVLGGLAPRVTFYSQQCRAFNLVWALGQSGQLPRNARVAVVGGGLGGMTVAVAALMKGAKVTLLEREAFVMPFQRGNNTRWIHPTVYDWPADMGGEGTGPLPYLQWKGGTTEEVISGLLNQWSRVAENPNLRVLCGYTVDRAPATEARGLRLIANGPSYFFELFDVVVFATGFGHERSLGSVDATSYWSNDDLGQRFARYTRVLVTGCGDGGLVDVLRLTLKNFRHEMLLERYFAGVGLESLKERLLDIDQGLEPSLNMSQQASVLYDEYSRLYDDYSEILHRRMGARLSMDVRDDTSVVLNSVFPSPLTPAACIINRLATYVLLRNGKIRYVAGLLDSQSARRSRSGKWRVQFPHGAAEEFDRVVVRHGTTNPLPSLFPALPIGDDGVARKPQWRKRDFRKSRSIAQEKTRQRSGAFLHAFSAYLDVLECADARLRGDEAAVSAVLGATGSRHAHAAAIELEAALWAFGRGDATLSTALALRAASHSRDEMRRAAHCVIAIAAIARGDIDSASNVVAGLSDPLQGGVLRGAWGAYMSLWEGMVLLALGDAAGAERCWNFLNRYGGESARDVLPPFARTLPLDRLIVDLFSNGSLATENAVAIWLSKVGLVPLARRDEAGHVLGLSRCIEALLSHGKGVATFCELGAGWSNPPTPDKLHSRLAVAARRLREEVERVLRA